MIFVFCFRCEGIPNTRAPKPTYNSTNKGHPDWDSPVANLIYLIPSGIKCTDLDKVRLVCYTCLTRESNLHRSRVVIHKDQLRAAAAVAVHHIVLGDDLLGNKVLNVLGRELILLLYPLVVFEEPYDVARRPCKSVLVAFRCKRINDAK